MIGVAHHIDDLMFLPPLCYVQEELTSSYQLVFRRLFDKDGHLHYDLGNDGLLVNHVEASDPKLPFLSGTLYVEMTFDQHRVFTARDRFDYLNDTSKFEEGTIVNLSSVLNNFGISLTGIITQKLSGEHHPYEVFVFELASYIYLFPFEVKPIVMDDYIRELIEEKITNLPTVFASNIDNFDAMKLYQQYRKRYPICGGHVA